MAQLFKNKALKEELANYQVPDFENKLKIVQEWLDSKNTGELAKKTETQCEQAFNQSFFVEILGYTGFPKEIYTIDPKGRTEAGGQKPDAVLGYFSPEIKHAVAVVEIKDAKIALDKSQQREGNLSPIQQAFKYKPQFKDCAFVIATNFIEIRLLRDNQLDYEHFTLEELANPADDYFIFKKFYYLLCAENFITKSGKSQTENILAEIRIEEEQITKKFYKEYKELRKQLIKNIGKNAGSVKTTDFPITVEKAQKIVDRIVFICFCEDLGLLPQDKLMEVIQYGQNSPLPPPIWDTIKQFFTAIDSGSERLGIPSGYNGELFKEDSEINNLKIDDDICRQFAELGKYDFAEDLSVNILGHIFEQSISDIEELKSLGSVAEMQQVSKRKKDGIFYTPEYIVDYIVTNSLGKYLKELETEILAKNKLKVGIRDENYEKRSKKAYLEYWEALKAIKVIDPACGSGAFLVRVFDYLFAEHKRVGKILGLNQVGIDFTTVYKSILQNNIYGVDLNPESVEITKLSLWLKTAEKGHKLVTLKNNIKCGNSLIDDSTVAGDKAFKWEEEFKEIMNAGGFDVVVGNPPWGANIDDDAEWLGKHYPNSTQRVKDTYKIFIDKGIQLLKAKGYFGYIVPNTFLFQPRYQDVRDIIEKYRHGIVNLGEKIFEDVELPSAILVLINTAKDSTGIKDYSKEDRKELAQLLGGLDIQEVISKQLGGQELWKDTGLTFDNVFLLKDAGINYQAVNVGKGEKGKSQLSSKLLYQGIVLDPDKDVEFWKGENINRFFIKDSTHNFVRTNYEDFKEENERVILNKDFFTLSPKILWRQTADRIIATVDERGIWFGRSVFGCVPHKEYLNKINIYYGCAVFNSKYIDYLYQQKVKEIGKVFPQVKLAYLRGLPFIVADDATQQYIGDLAKKLTKNYQLFFEAKDRFIRVVSQEFGLQKPSRKLLSFENISFDEFIMALKIKNLSLEKKSEILAFWEKAKSEAIELKTDIDDIEREIDDKIFDVYSLTSEERATIMETT